MKPSKTAHRLASVTPLTAEPRAGLARVGWLAGASERGEPLVDFAGNRAGPLRALSAVAASRRELAAAAERRQPVVLLFDGGDPSRPIVLAYLVAPPADEPPALAEVNPPAPPEVALVDGRRVRIEGKDEVVLECGEASITLRRNGKVILRGAYLESHAKGTNRIKGGSVQIN